MAKGDPLLPESGHERYGSTFFAEQKGSVKAAVCKAPSEWWTVPFIRSLITRIDWTTAGRTIQRESLPSARIAIDERITLKMQERLTGR
jgi:hypothetical protein